ncbi:hypothetical protein Cantr_07999 [Candida viswanathii]|uniref:Uncharacterized protein n=1 Tax=Candida viswanathii TaxID=5486 RepID=A0A367Y512_9ASCO|nr:hypothetical protein Cantr_07999 [Candida viswanathii]
MIALSCCYLEHNAYKSFSSPGIINSNYQIRIKLNQIFLKYNLHCLKELQLIISNINHLDNFNIGISGSILLNFINFYDDNLNSWTFSNGLLQLIKDSPELLQNHPQPPPAPSSPSASLSSEYPPFMANLSIYSKSYYFPNYYWKCLLEFREIVEKFNRHISHDYIFTNYHLLNQFLTKVLSVVEEPRNSYNPVVLKKMLQDWLIILPTNVHLLGVYHQFNDEELILLLLFKCLGKMLDSIFPRVMFFNLHTFGTSYNHLPHEQLQNITTSTSSLQLQSFVQYCMKVYSFFECRILLLNNLLMNNTSKIPQFTASINEIPLVKFNNVTLQPYNYIHFPQSIQLPINNLDNVNRYLSQHHLTYLYNTHHLQHFRYCFLNSPDIRFHAFNLGLEFPPTSQPAGPGGGFSFEDTIFGSYKDLISIGLTRAYEDLFSGAKDDQGAPETRRRDSYSNVPVFVILLREARYKDPQLVQWLNIFDHLRKVEIEQAAAQRDIQGLN